MTYEIGIKSKVNANCRLVDRYDVQRSVNRNVRDF
jgi:hypothetical protein